MDKESTTPSNVIKATAHLKEVKDDSEKDKKIPDVIEMLKGLVDRLERMEEKMDCRLREMEEKVDMLISSVVKAEADNMSVDESSSFVRGPTIRNVRGRGPTSLNVGGRFSGGRCGGLGHCRGC
ncbi:Uncharacterized protein Rs2_41869 [Raphanus sativus]|nr:Uncharacterized protein Rs2_41869 [Raphanus sativus]